MHSIQMSREQVGELERFFGGYRDRVVTVAQEPGSDRTTFCTGEEPFPGNVCAVLTLSEVEVISAEADAAGGLVFIQGELA